MFFNRGRAYNPDEVPGPEAVLRTDDHWSTHGLVGYWPMLEGRGGVVRDYARGHHGSFVNNPTWGPGQQGWATIYNNAALQYVSIGIHTIPQDVTMIVWANTLPMKSTWQVAFSLNGQYLRILNNVDGSIRIGYYPRSADVSNAVNTNAHWTVGQWDMYTLTSRSGQTRFYLNQTQTFSDELQGNLISSGNWQIGARGGGLTWRGSLGPTMVCERCLSADEVAELYAHPYLPLWRPASVSVWDMGLIFTPRPQPPTRMGPRMVIGG